VIRHRIRERLQDSILSGARPAGSKLVQMQLAEEFGVAQGVVREALLELQSCGLVETIDNRGVFVAELSAERLIEAYHVREMHEGLAARLCCDRVTRGQVRELLALAVAACELGRSGRLDEMGLADRQLHSRLIQLSGNSMLMRLAENYWVLGKVVRASRDPEAVFEEHAAILKAIEDGRAEDAERLTREHVRAGREAIARQIAEGRFRPLWVRGGEDQKSDENG